MLILFTLLCSMYLSVSTNDDGFIYLVVGRTGSGKSSLVNMMNGGNEIAKENASKQSETNSTTLYNTSYPAIQLIDTPGLYDTRGYTNSEINTLIRSALISESLYSISGVLLLLDPTELKLPIYKLIECVVSMFGSNVLNNMFMTFNKYDKINYQEKESLINEVMDILPPIYKNYDINSDLEQIQNTILFLDTKSDINLYSNKLKNIIINKHNDKLNVLSDEEIKKEIDEYYQIELENEDNYNITTEEIPYSEKRKRIIPKEKIVSYKERCNPQKSCITINFIFSIKWDCETYWSECVRTKTTTENIEEEYIYEWKEQKEKKVLKYTEEYLWSTAKNNMVNEMKSKVYQAIKSRSNNYKQEL